MTEPTELPELQYSTEDRALRPLVARTGRLLASVPAKYLAGLQKVVILNASDLPAREIRKLADEKKGRVMASRRGATQIPGAFDSSPKEIHRPGASSVHLRLSR